MNLFRRMPRSVLQISIGTTLLAFATSFLWPLNTIYVHTVLGRSLTQAGLVLLLQAGMSMLANLLGGHLHDRWGGKPTVVLGAATGSLAAVGIAFAATFPEYVLLMGLLGCGSGLIYPAMNAMAATVWQGSGRRAFNTLYVARNLGVALGASTGGLVAGYSFHDVFLGNAIVVALFAGYAWRLFPRAGAVRRGLLRPASGTGAGRIWRDAALVLLGTGLFLAQTAYSQWTTTVATHMQALGFAIPQYSVLWTLNGIIILAGQPLVSWFTSKVPAVSSHIRIGTFAYLVVFLGLVFARDYVSFVALMVLLTLGEMLVWPAVPAAADELAPPGRRGSYQGFISGATSLGRMVGPLAGGIVYDAYSAAGAFFVMALVLAGGLGVFAAAARKGSIAT